MRKPAMTFSLLALFYGATAVQAGEIVYRETDTGIYVELTGEKGPEVKVVSREELAEMALAVPDPEVQKAADEKRRMEKLAQQKAKLQAKRMKRQQEEEE